MRLLNSDGTVLICMTFPFQIPAIANGYNTAILREREGS